MKRNEYRPYLAAGVTAFLVLAAAIVFFFVIFHGGAVTAFFGTLARILRPVFMGVVLAFLLLPIQRFIHRGLTERINCKTPRGRRGLLLASTLLSLLLAALLVYILLAMVFPQVYVSIVGLVNSFPNYIRSVQGWLTGFLENNPEILNAILPYYNSATQTLEEWLRVELMPNFASVSDTISWLRRDVLPNVTGVVSNVSAVLTGLLTLLKDLLIAVIVSVYLLIRKDIFAAQSKKIVYSIFRTDIAERIISEAHSGYRILSGFINGKLLDSLIIGIITLIFCNLFKFPYPVLVATIIGVTNIIPFFGPFIGAIPCALLILLVSPIQSLYFVLFILVLQQFDGNILGPKILGESTGLASFWVLFSILLFGGLFGFAGMVLGVPAFAMIYSALSRLVRLGLRRKALPEETQEYLDTTGPLVKK